MAKTHLPTPVQLSGKDHHGYAGALLGALAGCAIGALTGAIAGPRGAIAGSIIGCLGGGLTGLGGARYAALQSHAGHRIEDMEAEAEAEIAVRKSLPPPPLKPPPKTWMDNLEESLSDKKG